MFVYIGLSVRVCLIFNVSFWGYFVEFVLLVVGTTFVVVVVVIGSSLFVVVGAIYEVDAWFLHLQWLWSLFDLLSYLNSWLLELH